MVRHSSFPRIFTLVLASAMLGGCATTRGTLDIAPPAALAPSSGPVVTLLRVDDRRTFEHEPRDPSIPSLKDGNIGDARITSRAIARKRNGYGMAMGDILLPEGRTVADLTREALTAALHRRGYRVVDPAVAGPDAIGLQAEIVEFWAWFSPGFWAAHLECRIHLRVTDTSRPEAPARDLRGYVRLGTQAATSRAWRNTVQQALDSLMEDAGRQLSAAPPGST